MLKKKIARIISEISNGFMTTILTPLIAINTLPLETKERTIYSLAYILSPIIPYFILRKMGKISDYEFTKREERPPYFVTMSILFGVIYFFIRTLDNQILTNISLNIFIVSSVVTFITFFWKISGHMTYSTLLFVTLPYLFPSKPYLFLFFLFTPFIAWSRIALEKHTLSQVTLGTLVTLSISILIYWGFW
jgi:membrane-associated phospholipid phosphatase